MPRSVQHTASKQLPGSQKLLEGSKSMRKFLKTARRAMTPAPILVSELVERRDFAHMGRVVQSPLQSTRPLTLFQDFQDIIDDFADLSCTQGSEDSLNVVQVRPRLKGKQVSDLGQDHHNPFKGSKRARPTKSTNGIPRDDEECEDLSPVPRLPERTCYAQETPDLFSIPTEDYPAQFIRLRNLNNGGEGMCSLVKHRKSPQLFALKTVYSPYTYRDQPVEAAMLDQLKLNIVRHPNIMSMEAYRYFCKDGLWMAEYYMPYLPLGDLSDFMLTFVNRSAKVPEDFIWKAFRDLANAIEFLHRGFYSSFPGFAKSDLPGLVHRDIKPENILLRDNPQRDFSVTRGLPFPDLVLSDFGHATLEEFTYTPAGTYLWRGPEMPRSSPKGDVWGMGAVIHFLIHDGNAPIGYPAGILDDPSQHRIWERRPEARRPNLDIRGAGYSGELAECVALALKMDEGRRPYAKVMVGMVERAWERVSGRFDGRVGLPRWVYGGAK